MPSSEEFGGSDLSHNVGVPPNIELLKAAARRNREAAAKARGQAGIPQQSAGYSQPVDTIAPLQSYTTYVGDSKDDELEMVRQKFKLANYYEALLEQPAFGDDTYNDPYACQVQSELTEWVKGRMSELVGIRNNPEGLLDDEVRLLKTFVQSLGPNGIKALALLANRVLNPPEPASVPVPAPRVEPVPLSPPEEEEDMGSSAMSFDVAPVHVPESVAPPPVKKHAVRVRRARIPGAPSSLPAQVPQLQPAKETESAPKRARKRPTDPLAAGKAMMAAMTQEAAPVAPRAQPAPPQAIPETIQPVPMPRGLSMSMAMEAKAGEALRSAKIIEANGGGVL